VALNFQIMMRKVVFGSVLSLLFLTSCGANKNSSSSKVKIDSSEEVLSGLDDKGSLETIKEQAVYHESETVYTDLVHTQLEVSFDWPNSKLNGVATIIAHPHFYATDSIVLDAKSMTIHEVSMNKKMLDYKYENDFLTVKLDRIYRSDENYKIKIKYTANPEDRRDGGSAAITSDKGLFFINPKGEDPKVMPQVWTQGETEASSVWFPTIDAPNVKTSQEMFITVDQKYTTLSNGKFLGSKENADGTRTDHWKQKLPHAPYLFMMAVGEFKVIEDDYTRPDGTKMPVNYYVEKEWEQYAQEIFGETPEMIKYFSRLLDLEFPWDKYHQIVVRDYVSGAMENTGAVIFGDYAYKTKRELLDANDQSTIAHELFHHWFGDLVTAESWSNLTLNESFANYSQYLWDEHRYGLDEADYQAMKEADGYFQSSQMQGYHDLVWFDYDEKEQMFDGHSYNKGGRILHMLRNYLGDEAFFKGISTYLKQNQFKAAEYNHLRLAMEEVSGEDLNWFFNQWYLASGHPTLKVVQTNDEATKTVSLMVSQGQDLKDFPLFILPMKIAVYDSNGKKSHKVVVDKEEQTLTFQYSGNLKCVVFDEQEMLLAKVTETKPIEQYIFQYYNSDRFKTRYKALEEGVEKGNAKSEQLVLDALGDIFWKLRIEAINSASKLSDEKKEKANKLISNLAVNDSKSQVRAAALDYLASNSKGADVEGLLESSIDRDQSYLVIGTALKGLGKVSPERALAAAKKYEGETSTKMISSIAQIYGLHGTAEQAPFFEKALGAGELSGFEELSTMNAFTMFNSHQELSVITEGIATYKKLGESGGYYTKMFMERNLDYLIKGLNDQKTDLEAQILEYEKTKDAALADQNRKKVSEIKTLVEKIEAIKPEK
jgi:aminopeptidase N